MIEFSKDLLPLKNRANSQRNIQVETCSLDETHAQIRGVLTDSRIDFEDPGAEHVVHCIVVNLTIDMNKRIITAAQFATPRMAVDNLCEKLPSGADNLVGVALGQGFSAKIKELYEGTNSCFHLYTLLQAVVPYLPQVYSWNKDFRFFDDGLPTESIPLAMRTMAKYARNSCHAWGSENGGIIKDFKDDNYAPVLKRIAPRAGERWKKHQEELKQNSKDVIAKDS